MTSKTRILVTGAGGYIGSALTKKLLANNFQLNVLDTNISNTYLKPLIGNRNVNFFEGDIRDINLIKKAHIGADVLIHLAGISDGRMGKANPELTKEINFSSLENILMVAKQSGTKKVLFASTFGVYGNKYHELLTEDLKPNPTDPYSKTKLQCENLLSSHSNIDFTTYSIRSAMVYGFSSNMRFDFLINQLTKIAYEKNKLSIFGGTQKRPQIHISDLTDVFLKLAACGSDTSTNKTYNAVTFNPSVIDIANAIKELLPKTEIEILPSRNNEDTFELDGSALSKLIGPYNKITLTEGIKEIILNLNTHELD